MHGFCLEMFGPMDSSHSQSTSDSILAMFQPPVLLWWIIFILWASSLRKLSKVKQSVILIGGVDEEHWMVWSRVKAAEERPVSGSGNTSGRESPENQLKTWGSAFRASSVEELRQCAMGNLGKLIFLLQMHHILVVLHALRAVHFEYKVSFLLFKLNWPQIAIFTNLLWQEVLKKKSNQSHPWVIFSVFFSYIKMSITP